MDAIWESPNHRYERKTLLNCFHLTGIWTESMACEINIFWLENVLVYTVVFVRAKPMRYSATNTIYWWWPEFDFHEFDCGSFGIGLHRPSSANTTIGLVFMPFWIPFRKLHNFQYTFPINWTTIVLNQVWSFMRASALLISHKYFRHNERIWIFLSTFVEFPKNRRYNMMYMLYVRRVSITVQHSLNNGAARAMCVYVCVII